MGFPHEIYLYLLFHRNLFYYLPEMFSLLLPFTQTWFVFTVLKKHFFLSLLVLKIIFFFVFFSRSQYYITFNINRLLSCSSPSVKILVGPNLSSTLLHSCFNLRVMHSSSIFIYRLFWFYLYWFSSILYNFSFQQQLFSKQILDCFALKNSIRPLPLSFFSTIQP